MGRTSKGREKQRDGRGKEGGKGRKRESEGERKGEGKGRGEEGKERGKDLPDQCQITSTRLIK